MSDQSTLTNKSKAYRESVYQDTHHAVDPEVHREVDRQVYLVDNDSTEAAYRPDGHLSGLRKMNTVS